MERTQVWASGGGVQSAAIAALICQGKLCQRVYEPEQSGWLTWINK